MPSSTVLRNAHGRLALATPGLEEACEVETIFISLATGKVTSHALLVSGPATASTLSSPASLRSALAACAGLAPSSMNDDPELAAVDAAGVVDLLLQQLSVVVLVRPHSANGPLLGTIAPTVI